MENEKWEERAKKFDEICPNLAAALRKPSLHRQCEAIEKMPFENGTMIGWISAIECDGFNYFPKKIQYERMDEAFEQGLFIHYSEAECQSECDRLNGL